MTLSGIEPTTLRLVAQRLKQLSHRVPHRYWYCVQIKGTCSLTCNGLFSLLCSPCSCCSMTFTVHCSCIVLKLCYHNWGFPVIFLSCKANNIHPITGQKGPGHGPHYPIFLSLYYVYCLCVMCVVLLPPGVNLIAVKYIYIYHIIYIILYIK
jgi:hypothetical protein